MGGHQMAGTKAGGKAAAVQIKLSMALIFMQKSVLWAVKKVTQVDFLLTVT